MQTRKDLFTGKENMKEKILLTCDSNINLKSNKFKYLQFFFNFKEAG